MLYKLYNIGLLPLNSADWIDLVPLHHVNIIMIVISKMRLLYPIAIIDFMLLHIYIQLKCICYLSLINFPFLTHPYMNC